MGFELVATSGTARFFGEHGITVKRANKVMEGRPHIVDDMKNGAIQLDGAVLHVVDRSEEHTSELQSLMRISYAVFCLKKKNKYNTNTNSPQTYHKILNTMTQNSRT